VEQLRAQLAEELLRAVRKSGMTWAALGERLGLSADGARIRYGPVLDRVEEEERLGEAARPPR
jgi:hypothetical protein